MIYIGHLEGNPYSMDSVLYLIVDQELPKDISYNLYQSNINFLQKTYRHEN